MQKVLEILAKTLSVVLYPLLLPTYGFVLYAFYGVKAKVAIPSLWRGSLGLECISGTLIITAIMPLLVFLLMWKTKRISSLHLDNAAERSEPYIWCIFFFAVWYFFFSRLYLSAVADYGLYAIMALTIVWVVNHWWKISAHLTGMGCLLGGVFSFGLLHRLPVTQTTIVVLILSLLLMYARLYLRAHTPLQVVCGFLLGLACTLVPNWILLLISYASV